MNPAPMKRTAGITQGDNKSHRIRSSTIRSRWSTSRISTISLPISSLSLQQWQSVAIQAMNTSAITTWASLQAGSTSVEAAVCPRIITPEIARWWMEEWDLAWIMEQVPCNKSAIMIIYPEMMRKTYREMRRNSEEAPQIYKTQFIVH